MISDEDAENLRMKIKEKELIIKELGEKNHKFIEQTKCLELLRSENENLNKLIIYQNFTLDFYEEYIKSLEESIQSKRSIINLINLHLKADVDKKELIKILDVWEKES